MDNITMTDFAKWQAFLTDQGVEFELGPVKHVTTHAPSIVIEKGYMGFYFAANFDQAGKLQEYGSYEY